MRNMLSSQDSYEEVVPDTLPTRKALREINRCDVPASPPKRPKKKKKAKKKQLCEETVEEDTTVLVNLYLVTKSSLTGKDIGMENKHDADDDLETDGGPDSDDENEQQEEVMKKLVERLADIGDKVNKEFEKKDNEQFNSALASFLQAQAYNNFCEAIMNLSHLVCGNEPDVDSLAFVFFLTQRYVETAKQAGRQVNTYVCYGQRFIRERFGQWIVSRGGWGHVLEGTAV